MTLIDMLLAQLSDLFRIGMMVMLVVTASRTAGTVGTLVPMALGVIFIAVLIPISMTAGSGDRATAIALGLVSNAIILGVILAIRFAVDRLLQSKG